MKEKSKVLLADEEQNILKSLKRFLIDIDCKIFTAESGEKGLELLETEQIHIIISDYRMPGMSGVEFLSKVKEKYPETIRIVLSGYADTAAIVEAINLGQVYKFIPKPWDDQDLLSTVKDAFERYRLQHKNIELFEELTAKYSESKELTRILEDSVNERTRDLQLKNKALTIAQNILNYLQIGVIGIDPSGMVVYMNRSLPEFIDTTKLMLGESAKLGLENGIYEMVISSMEDQTSYSMIIDEGKGLGLMCSPLPNESGVIGLFGCFNLSYCVNANPYHVKLTGVNNG